MKHISAFGARDTSCATLMYDSVMKILTHPSLVTGEELFEEVLKDEADTEFKLVSKDREGRRSTAA